MQWMVNQRPGTYETIPLYMRPNDSQLQDVVGARRDYLAGFEGEANSGNRDVV